jgi:hypothetical protein
MSYTGDFSPRTLLKAIRSTRLLHYATFSSRRPASRGHHRRKDKMFEDTPFGLGRGRDEVRFIPCGAVVEEGGRSWSAFLGMKEITELSEVKKWMS